MSLFGEINLPTSRALWDDDYEEFHPSVENLSLNWDNDNNLPSEKIDTLLIIESQKLTKVAKISLLSDKKPVCKIADINLEIYKVQANKYVVLYEDNGKVTTGEVVEKLIPWIKNSNKIVSFNSMPSVNYQSNSTEEKPATFMHSLCTGKVQTFATKLEAPNLATGLSAGVLSYCHHNSLAASLYICYMEPRQLDSISAEPILDLFRKLNIPNVKPYRINDVNNDSFLYM